MHTRDKQMLLDFGNSSVTDKFLGGILSIKTQHPYLYCWVMYVVSFFFFFFFFFSRVQRTQIPKYQNIKIKNLSFRKQLV